VALVKLTVRGSVPEPGLVSENKGETWTPVPAGGRYFLGKLLPIDQSLWAIGQSVILQQSGGGKEWKKNPNLVTDRTVSETEAVAAKTPVK